MSDLVISLINRGFRLLPLLGLTALAPFPTMANQLTIRGPDSRGIRIEAANADIADGEGVGRNEIFTVRIFGDRDKECAYA